MKPWPNKSPNTAPEPMPFGALGSAFAVDSFGGVAQLLSLGHLTMNSKCPVCSHHFRLRERKRFITWHLTRRPIPCPDCHTTLIWEPRAHVRLWTGMFLIAVFDGILLGTALAPQIGVLLGFSSPQSAYDPFWESWIVHAMEIASLILTLGAFALLVSGFLRYRLIRYE
jgi:hypothetical protein